MTTNLQTILNQLRGVKPANGGFMALCPAHNDHEPSLSVREVDGRLLLHCFAGCPTEVVLEALGLKPSDLSGNGDKPAAETRVVATYDYVNASGELLYQVVRYEPKTFRQRKPDGNGGWEWKLSGVKPVPYRLPRVVAAVERGETVFVVEGEKDVHSLESIGLTATTNAGGAGKWRADWDHWFQNAHIVILPDNDEVGKRHAADVAAKLRGAARSVKIVELPNLPEKGDISDWLAAGGTKNELLQLVAAAAEWEPAEPAEEENPFAIQPVWAEDEDEFEADWVVPDLILSNGITILAGQPGSGKTTFAAEIVRHVATGQPHWLGEVKQTRVLWLPFDDKFPHIRKTKLFGIPERSVCRPSEEYPLTPTTLPAYVEFCKTNGIGLVVVDTLNDFLPCNDYDRGSEPQRAMALLRKFVNEADVAVLAIAHTNKDPIQKGVGKLAHSTVFAAKCDFVALMETADEDADYVTFRTEKSRYGGRLEITLLKDAQRFVPIERGTAEKPAAAIMKLVKERGSVTRKELIDALSHRWSERTISHNARLLVDKGFLAEETSRQKGGPIVYTIPSNHASTNSTNATNATNTNPFVEIEEIVEAGSTNTIYPAEEEEPAETSFDNAVGADKTGKFASFANPAEPDKTACVDKTGLTKLADKTGVDKTADVTKLADKTGLREVLDYIRAVGKTTRQELLAAYEGVYSARTLDRYIKRLVSECLIREVHDRNNKNRVCYEPAGSFDNVPDQSSFDKTTLTKLTVETDKTVLPEPADKTGLSKQPADQPDLPDKPADDDRLLSPQAALRQVHWYATTFRATRTELAYAFKDILTETELNSILDQLIANGHIREIPDGDKLRYESTGFPLPETEPVEENIPDVQPQPNAESLPYVCQNPKCKQDVVLTVWKRKENKEPLCYRYLCTHCGHDGLCTVADYEYWLKREAMFERIRAKKNKPTDEPDKDDGRLVAVDVESKLTTTKDYVAMKGELNNALRQKQPANYYTQSVKRTGNTL